MRQDSNVQIYPSRVTVTPRRINHGVNSLIDNYSKKLFKQSIKPTYLDNFKVEKKDYSLSKTSKRKIFDSINSMYCLSKPRNIEMQNGKTLYNFRLAFITLTLPSKQKHSDVEIKNKLINQFLFEIKRKYKISNFVWKAELQKNENIHFHLIIDKYIDYQALRRRWNRILNKLDYVKNYQSKMQNQKLSEYHKNRQKYKVCTLSDSAKAYAKGVQSNWSNPNSVDIKSVFGKKDLAIYLGKYFAKKVSSSELTDLEQTRLKNFGRVWSRSYSLVKLKFQNKYIVSEVQALLKYLDSTKKFVKKVEGQFFTVYYFNVSELSKSFKSFHSKFMFAIAEIYKYPIPIN